MSQLPSLFSCLMPLTAAGADRVAQVHLSPVAQ